MHCHQLKEAINADLRRNGKWERDLAWRYPLPDNLGLTLEVDRGNVVKEVKEKSPAADAGLKPGDVMKQMNGVPTHSFADAQYALDRAPKTGTIELEWRRGEDTKKEKLTLPEGWRKSDLSWRPSMTDLVPNVRLYGTDLTADEKKTLGIEEKRLAFRQKDSVPTQARIAGIRGGDVILGLDDKPLEMDVDRFLHHVRRNYLVGDRVTVNLLRHGKRMDLPMTLLR
jgi:S1-C subfamily serine protease